MSTYSLTLRQPLGRKLSIGELDKNFRYLQDIALSPVLLYKEILDLLF